MEPQFPVKGNRATLPGSSDIEEYVNRADGTWPTEPRERRLLLDPVNDGKFESHFIPTLTGELIGRSPKANCTIEIFDLNRADRRHQRDQRYRSFLSRLTTSVDRGIVRFTPGTEAEMIFDFANIEFGGTWYLLLRRIAEWINSTTGRRGAVSSSRIQRFFELASEELPLASLIEQSITAFGRDDQARASQISPVASAASLRAPIKSIEISNFKSIEDLTVNFATGGKQDKSRLASSLIILGENATGKSSILEGVALTLTTDIARRRLKLDWHSLALDPSQLGVEFDGRQHHGRNPKVKIELTSGSQFVLGVEGGIPVVERTSGTRQVPIFAYGAYRRFSTRTRRGAPDRHIHNLFDGEAIANPEPWLKRLPVDAFDMVIRSMRDLLSVEGDFEVIERDSLTRLLRVKAAVTEPNGTRRFMRTPLHAVSSGYRSMLGMLCDIMRGLMDPEVYEGFESFQTARGVILIDEIEAHLHPRWKMQVMSSLRAALPNMTFIVTTHDPLCLRGMADGEIIVLQRIATADSDSQSQLPTVVQTMPNLPPVQEMRLEQLLTSDFFQMFSTDDAVADRQLARVADLIARRGRTNDLNDDESRVLSDFERDIATSLPVGSSEVHRIVQDAVAEYLKRRRNASSKALQGLREKAKSDILAALEGL